MLLRFLRFCFPKAGNFYAWLKTLALEKNEVPTFLFHILSLKFASLERLDNIKEK